MKTHSATEPERPRGPAPGPGFLPRAAWVFLALAALFTTGGVRAQSFTPEISQVIATEDNDTYFDHNGDTPAVIILKNNGSVTGTISNFALTDTPAVPRKWVIPTGAGGAPLTMAPGSTLVFFASALNRPTPPYATNFLLPCGATAYLYNANVQTPALLSQQTVTGSECDPCLPLITGQSTSAYLVPTANNPPVGTDWKLPGFSDTSWPRGQPCLGYESDPLVNNMILYSTFDTPDVNVALRTITDVSGPTLHTGTWPPPTPPPVTHQIGIPMTSLPKILQNVEFYGINNPNSYVEYPTHTELNPGTGSYSFSVWVRPTSTDISNGEVIFRKGRSSTTDTTGYALFRGSNNSAGFAVYSPGLPNVTISTPGSVMTTGVWQHLMVVITRSTSHTIKIYHNGVERASSSITATQPVGGGTQNLFLARAVAGGGPVNFTGRMDDYVIWGRALPATDVTRVFDAGNAGKKVTDPGLPGGSGVIFAPCIQTNVQAAMKGINPGIYERIPFFVANPSAVSAMTLRVKYADGFIAYINGVEIARRNAPTGAVWNSAATADRPDASAIIAEDIPVPAAGIAALTVDGTSILAIHAMNFTANQDRFLICPELCYEEEVVGDCYVTTSGKNFWITYPGNFPDDAGNPLQLSVCITGNSGTVGQVTVPGLAFTQNFSLPAGGKIDIVLPKAASLDKSDTIENKGVHIIASKNVAVYGKTRIDYSTDTFLAHQYKTLGSHYIVLGWGNSWVGYPDLNGSQFGIVATADNTHVTVTPKAATGSHAAGVPYNFILNQGQTYLLRNTSDSPADLTGTEITSDSPIAVFGGHRCANITGSLIFCDTVLEQCLPVALWNTEYAAAPLATRTASELIRVVAAVNGTNISLNGVAQPPVMNKGDKRNFNVTGGAVFTANNKFLAAHMSRSFDADDVIQSDPFQINAQPTASWLAGYKFCTAPAAEFSAHHANVIARNAELPGVTLNPAPLFTGPIIAIPATGFSYRQVTLAAGTTYTSGGRTHGIEIYGWGEYDSYGHTGGMGFNDTSPPTFTQCPPDITIFTTPGAGGETAILPDLAAQFGVTDNCCPESSISIVQTPGPGTRFPPGDYQVIIQATDCNQNTITCIVIVHVRTDPRQQAFPAAFGNPALEATIWGWDANPDGDFLTNEQEWMLGTNMAVASALGDAFTFKRVMRGGQLVVELSYRRRNDNPALEYHPEGGNNLMGWFGGLGHFEDISAVPDALAGFTRVTAWSVDSGLHDRFFVRLRLRRN